MKSNKKAMHLPKIEYFRRLLVMLLCLTISLSAFASNTLYTVQALDSPLGNREEIKARLMEMIENDGWDPYSANMSIEEFYALMELFDEGKLPLESKTASDSLSISSPGFGEPGIEEPGIEDPSAASEAVYIPRTMFMFSGLGDYDGTENAPGEYNNNTGSPEDPINYPAGLDNYGMGYLCPPADWNGVPVNGESQAVVIVKDTNRDKPQIAGDVDQSLFIEYPDRYVRRVTAQNTEVTILGAIKLSGQEEYVYYYLTSDMQSSDVSTTTLPKGQKFIVEYLPIEHEITYEVRMNSVGGTDVTNDPASVNVNGTDVEDTWENIIFGTNHPSKTDAAAYSFTVWAPYGYTVEIYYDDVETPQLGKDTKGDYTSVNGGWALGMHPDYSIQNRFTLLPDTDKGPQALTISGALYDNNVLNNRKVIAVVTENGAPVFDAASIIKGSEGTSNRGTSAYNKVKTKDGELVPYDYEDVYRWANGLESNYEYDVDHDTISYTGKNNLAAGNIATSDKWGWQDDQPQDGITLSTMEPQEDGTYSFQWTFQTNNNNNGNILDALQINGVSFRVPFLPKQKINGFPDEQASGVGLKSWYTEGTLPDGATVRVEMLLGFNGTPQRVYRITVTGARSNVTITGMNLMQGSGADEFVVYDLDGVTGATERGNTNHAEAIRYYSAGSGWGDLNSVDENVFESNLIVHQDPEALNWTGDPDLHGANIRFKLSDGYDSPYFLWENARGGTVISGQASIDRNPDGTVDYGSMKSVLTFDELGDGDMMDSQHIYTDGSGWYYIRVTTQEPHKIALLTIIARPVRYVVRYVPSYASVADDDPGGGTRDDSLVGIVDNPANMPQFEHYEDKCHESFFNTDNAIPGEQYDDADGAYYDTAVDDIVRLPSNTPTDPGGSGAKYRFVDWVLVDENYNPVWASTDTSGHTVQVVTDEHGNRLLVNENGYLATLSANNTLEASNVKAHWDSGSHVLRNDNGDVVTAPQNWVLLNRDGKPAYADGTPVEMPEETDLTALISGWFVQDVNGSPANISACSEFHYRSNHITLADINQYAIPNEGLGGNETDIYVLRLMPVWEPIENPFHYRVALNWVDAQGNVYQEYFDDYWQEVLTDWTLEGGYLTVQVIKDAVPFLNWIAQHPTYSFWDAVNNNNALYRYAIEHDGQVDDDGRKALEDEMARAIEEYLPALLEDDPNVRAQYEEVLKALCTRDISGLDADGNSVTDNQGNEIDDFWRLGNYAYQVHEDEGTIVIWMYENKGGLIFNKDVQEEPFTADDEFYFTVANVIVGEESKLTGIYKAYPEQCYDENGNPRATLDVDAWLVSFVDGKIENIVKNDGSSWPRPAVTYFTLQDGEGIALYVPAGEYSIAELGSKSGGSYKVSVTYTATDGSMIPKEEWDIPDEEDLWLRGSLKEYIEPLQDGEGNYQTDENGKFIYEYPENIQQVTATVNFDVGEQDVVQTLTFANKTAALSIEKALDSSDEDAAALANYQNKDFYFDVDLKLPTGYTPIWKEDTYDEDGILIAKGNYYYFTMNIFDVATGKLVKASEIKLTEGTREENGTEITIWQGSITLKAGQRAVIVMSVPESDGTINYWVEETWKQSDWKASEWDSATGKPNIFTEMWIGKSGVAEAGTEAAAKVTNWYGEPPEECYLAITENHKKGGNPNDTFLYKITNEDTGEEMIVSVPGGGETIVQCPPGNYTVEEITDWAWRYEDGECEQDMPINVNGSHTLTSPAHADFTNDRNGKAWLGGENRKNNVFAFSSSKENKNVSTPYSWFTDIIDSIVQIFR